MVVVVVYGGCGIIGIVESKLPDVHGTLRRGAAAGLDTVSTVIIVNIWLGQVYLRGQLAG